jgi:uncharacterized membrane protein (DUF4010 family)
MFVRVLILVAVLATRFLPWFAAIIFPALLVTAAAGLWLLRKTPRDEPPSPPGNPIALVPALGFVLFIAVAAVAAAWAQDRFGEQGLAVLLLIMGSMDVDVAIVTAGGLAPGQIATAMGAMALAGTIVLNMSVKLGITIAYARRAGVSAAVALAAGILTLLASILFIWFRM